MVTITLWDVPCLTFEYSPWPAGMEGETELLAVTPSLLTGLFYSQNSFCRSDAIFTQVPLCFAL